MRCSVPTETLLWCGIVMPGLNRWHPKGRVALHLSVDEWLQTALPSFPTVPEHLDQKDAVDKWKISRFSDGPPVAVLGRATLDGCKATQLAVTWPVANRAVCRNCEIEGSATAGSSVLVAARSNWQIVFSARVM